MVDTRGQFLYSADMDTPITPSPEELKKRIEAHKVKEQEFKRFKCRYQGALKEIKLETELRTLVARERYRLLRAVTEIAGADKDFRRRDIIDYCRKVLTGLGYES